MKLQDHIGKVTWSLLDKALFIVFGLFSFVQMNYSEPYQFGLYMLLVSINTWIFVVSDAFALQNLIQFGANPKRVKKVNLLALVLHTLTVLLFLLIITFFKESIIQLLNDTRLTDVLSSLIILALLSIPRTYCIKFAYRNHQMDKLFWINFVFFGSMIASTYYFILQNGTITQHNFFIIYEIGMGLSSLIAIILTFKYLKFSTKGDIKLKELISFSIPYTITGAFHYLPRQLDVFIIKIHFSTAFVGIYSSAKILFRVFEEGINAANGLVYPASVKAFEQKDNIKMKAIITKSISFTFVAYIFAAIFLQTPISNYLIDLVLNEKYLSAIIQFKVLLWGAVFLPFTILFTILTAHKKYIDLLIIVVISSVLSIVTFYIIGIVGNENMIPLGLVVYNFSLGMILLIYVNTKLKIKLGIDELFSSLRDSLNFLKMKR